MKKLIGRVRRKFYDSLYKENSIAIIAIAKNESRYIREWISFHLSVGIDKIILYDNESTDGMINEIGPYIDNGYVIYNKIAGKDQQINAYNDALKKYTNQFKYMAFIDCDEFLYPVNPKETIISVIEELLKENKSAGGICVNWAMYGSSGYEKRPDGDVVKNFTWRAKVPNGRGTNCIKTICMPSLVKRFEHPHFPIYKYGNCGISTDGVEVKGWSYDISEYVGLRINHYFTKSKEEWIERREGVGRADNSNLIRTINEFYEHDNNDVEDNSAIIYLEHMDCAK